MKPKSRPVLSSLETQYYAPKVPATKAVMIDLTSDSGEDSMRLPLSIHSSKRVKQTLPLKSDFKPSKGLVGDPILTTPVGAKIVFKPSNNLPNYEFDDDGWCVLAD